jgi:ATP-dependent HslUV protease subunit HslV
VIEPDEGVSAIGSGGPYAKSAALALRRFAAEMSAEQIAREALAIAADLCIYTNHELTVESLELEPPPPGMEEQSELTDEAEEGGSGD